MSFFDQLLQSISGAISSVGDTVQSTINNALGGIGNAINFVQYGIDNTIGQAQNNIGRAINGAYSGITGTIDNVQTNLANTIGTVQGNLLSRIDSATNAAYNAANNVINAVTTNVSNGLSAVTNAVNGATSYLENGIQSVQNNVGNALGAATAAISGGIQGALQGVGNTIAGVESALSQDINGGLAAVTSGIGGLVAGIQSGIDNGLSNVGQAIATVETGITSSLANIAPDLGKISDAIKQLTDPTGLLEVIKQDIGGVNTAITSTVMDAIRNKQDVIAKLAAGEYKTFAEVAAALADPPQPDNPVTAVLDGFYTLVGLFVIANQVAEIYARPTVQSFNQRQPNVVISPEVLATMYQQSIIDDDTGALESSYSGVNRARWDLYKLLAGEPPGLGEILNLLNRGTFTEQQARLAIEESRLKLKYTDAALELRNQLPAVGELVQLATKHSFDDDIVSAQGLDGDLPQTFIEQARKIGLSPEYARYFWRAHWSYPGASQAFEMLHRTAETGVTEADVTELMRLAGIAPRWRQPLLAISSSVFSRVDIRRMYKVKVLDRAGVKAAYLALGYNEQRAEALTDFSIKLEDEIGQLSPDTQERQIFTALINLYADGKRTEADLRQAAQEFGWGATAIENEIRLAKLKQEHNTRSNNAAVAGLLPATLQRKVIDETERLYIAGHRSIDDVTAVMQSFNVPQDIIDLEVEFANLAKENTVKPVRSAGTRELAIGEIIKAFTLHQFTAEQATAELLKLGLTQADATIEIQVAALQAANALRGSILSNVKAAYIRGDLTETDVTGILTPFGFTPEEINGHIAEWSIEKLLKRKTVPESTLARWAKAGVISTDEYAVELKKDGYSDADVLRFVAEHGFAGVTGA